jgi:tetratricopeptide (TPR) repeat protein
VNYGNQAIRTLDSDKETWYNELKSRLSSVNAGFVAGAVSTAPSLPQPNRPLLSLSSGEPTANERGRHPMSVTETSCENLLERGIYYKIEGLYDEAISQFRAALAEEPDHPLARMELGLVYGFIGLFDESIAELERAVSLAPDHLASRLNLAKTYCMLGMDDRARTEFERVLGYDPENEEALRNLVFLT